VAPEVGLCTAEFAACDDPQMYLVGAVDKCSARPHVQSNDSGVSGVRPIAPNTWIARSSTRVCRLAATNLMADTSTRAAWLPCWSITHAARSVSSRAWSISTREWPIQSCTLAKSLRCLPNAVRVSARSAHQLQRQLALADGAHAMVYAAGTETGLRQCETPAFLSEEIRHRYAYILEHHFAVTLGRVVVHDGHVAPDVQAGSIHRHQDHRMTGVRKAGFGGDSHHDAQLAVRMQRPRGEPLAAIDHVLVADRRMLVRMLVASAEATSGSVIAKQERISPCSNGVSQRSACSGVANRCSSSMLPVSGALQLNTSEAHGRRPTISASGAYSTLLSPGARLVGTQAGQEQVPQAFGLGLGLQIIDQRERVPPALGNEAGSRC